MAGRLDGKVALVTGAAKGQGEGVATTFAAEGARVMLCDVLDDRGAAVVEAIRDGGGHAAYSRCDVSDERAVADVVERTVAVFGGIDILYNNAAIISYGAKVADMDVAQWDRTLAVNLRGPFLCAKFALPHLIARGGGVILNVSSHGAVQASPVGVADYGAAKGGLVSLTYYLASEYGRDGVRANCLMPGPIPTDLNAPFLGNPEGRQMTEMFIPLGRVGEIADMARAAVFLASDEAKWITGAVLRVDGGMVIQ